MKKLTFISLMICCLAAIGLTSCNNDVEYKGLTNEQKAEAFNTVKGSYKGDQQDRCDRHPADFVANEQRLGDDNPQLPRGAAGFQHHQPRVG